VDSATAVYLKELGITNAEGVVKKDMQDKFKQINRYVEIIEGIIKDVQFEKNITVADMGSGKGYLTFALYDYLTNTLKREATIVGVEMREVLVNKCNHIVTNCHYKNLKFEKGTIQDAALPALDMLIALHACDTATDDAIYKGIQANAKVIICAPCCHKQIRALILEAHGYKTKVFEFIATEHTPKNVLIVGSKISSRTEAEKQENLQKVAGLKKLFNIKQHYLETLF